jgi:hypothetical protein
MKRKSSNGQLGSNAPDRVAKRPRPDDWQEDELLTLAEAAALFWPEGPLTTTSLRTAVRDRQLEVAVIAAKFFTTKTAIRRMSTCSLLKVDELPMTEGVEDGMPKTVAAFRRNLAQTATGRI